MLKKIHGECIVSAHGIPLFGRYWINAFQLHINTKHVRRSITSSVSQVFTPLQNNDEVDTILKDYTVLFSKHTKGIVGHKAYIRLNDNAEPKLF